MKGVIKLEKLVVNNENYRFDSVDNQEDAIDLMLEEKGEEIFNLAKHIYRHGLDSARDVRVIEIKNNLYKVLDGNRRITAIKCLNNPSIIKADALKRKFTNLLKEHGSVLDEVSVYIYPSEEAAAEWIKIDHTGKNNGVGQDPWDPSGKERFDYKFGGKLTPAKQIQSLYEEETDKEIKTKNLKISTVNRILSNPESRSYLGLDVREGIVVLTSAKKEVVARIGQLFDKIIVDDVTVKEVYHTPDSVKFMKNLFGNKPKVQKDIVTITPKGTTRPASKKIKSLPKSGARNVLIPKACNLRIHNTKINNIYHELKEIPLDLATNAVGVLFRVFLETCIDFYIQEKKVTGVKEKAKLREKIAAVADFMEKQNIATKTQLKNIKNVATKGGAILSVNYFHEYVHSFTTQPSPVDLVTKWDNLEEIFTILWEDINITKKRK